MHRFKDTVRLNSLLAIQHAGFILSIMYGFAFFEGGAVSNMSLLLEQLYIYMEFKQI